MAKVSLPKEIADDIDKLCDITVIIKEQIVSDIFAHIYENSELAKDDEAKRLRRLELIHNISQEIASRILDKQTRENVFTLFVKNSNLEKIFFEHIDNINKLFVSYLNSVEDKFKGRSNVVFTPIQYYLAFASEDKIITFLKKWQDSCIGTIEYYGAYRECLYLIAGANYKFSDTLKKNGEIIDFWAEFDEQAPGKKLIAAKKFLYQFNDKYVNDALSQAGVSLETGKVNSDVLNGLNSKAADFIIQSFNQVIDARESKDKSEQLQDDLLLKGFKMELVRHGLMNSKQLLAKIISICKEGNHKALSDLFKYIKFNDSYDDIHRILYDFNNNADLTFSQKLMLYTKLSQAKQMKLDFCYYIKAQGPSGTAVIENKEAMEKQIIENALEICLMHFNSNDQKASFLITLINQKQADFRYKFFESIYQKHQGLYSKLKQSLESQKFIFTQIDKNQGNSNLNTEENKLPAQVDKFINKINAQQDKKFIKVFHFLWSYIDFEKEFTASTLLDSVTIQQACYDLSELLLNKPEQAVGNKELNAKQNYINLLNAFICEAKNGQLPDKVKNKFTTLTKNLQTLQSYEGAGTAVGILYAACVIFAVLSLICIVIAISPNYQFTKPITDFVKSVMKDKVSLENMSKVYNGLASASAIFATMSFAGAKGYTNYRKQEHSRLKITLGNDLLRDIESEKLGLIK